MAQVKRRQFLIVEGALLAAPVVLPRFAFGQSQRRTARVAILYVVDRSRSGYLLDAFKDAMSKSGWREGVNIEYMFREAHGDLAQLDPLAAELVTEKPDLILASSDPAALAVQKYTQTIPIVFSLVADPVAAGLVASLAKPGRNATGPAAGVASSGLSGKRLQMLKEIIPDLRRVALLYDPSDAADARLLQPVQVAADKLTLEVQTFTAGRPEDFRPSLAAMTKAKIGAALIGNGTANFINRELIAGLAMEHGIPTIGTFEGASEAGMLMSYGADLVRLYRITARYADQILRGARPADLPVEQPSILTLAINLKTAKALGIKFPNSILVRADRVIE